MKAQHDYIEKQLDSLKAASQPRKDELDRLKELDRIISSEEQELERLAQGSKKLKEKVCGLNEPFTISFYTCNVFESNSIRTPVLGPFNTPFLTSPMAILFSDLIG